MGRVSGSEYRRQQKWVIPVVCSFSLQRALFTETPTHTSTMGPKCVMIRSARSSGIAHANLTVKTRSWLREGGGNHWSRVCRSHTIDAVSYKAGMEHASFFHAGAIILCVIAPCAEHDPSPSWLRRTRKAHPPSETWLYAWFTRGGEW